MSAVRPAIPPARLVAHVVMAMAILVLSPWWVPTPALAGGGPGDGANEASRQLLDTISAGDPAAFAPRCHASSGLDTTVADMIGANSWTCWNADWSSTDPVVWLRFDRSAWRGAAELRDIHPRYFFTRTARHEAIDITALDDGGTMRTVHYDEADGEPFAAGPVFALELPAIDANTRAVLVRIERPHSIPLMTEARLAYNLENPDWSQFEMMLLAFVLGMLILPLLFDLSFYAVLRERFILLHAGMVAMMMVYVLTAGGLISSVAPVTVAMLAITAPLAWAIGIGLSLLFFARFVEPGAQSKAMRCATIAVGWWTMAVPGFFALQLHALQPLGDPGYFLAFVPAMLTIIACVVEAIARGSRAARFLAVAWTPMVLASFERFLRGMGVYSAPSTLDQLLYFAVAFEVIVMSLAIANRFLALRQERDAAITEAQTLERLSERDPLTGLMNRRAVADRFADLRTEGFNTFALLDLDMFKQVNDRFGHQVGDEALIACADAIRGGEERGEVAVRLGGEEFVILLRGEDTLERAEALRQAIPVRIARQVEGCDQIITASMGVIAIPHDAGTMMTFSELYARADKLLYEAKAAGRNRTNYERLVVFRSAPRTREAANEAA